MLSKLHNLLRSRSSYQQLFDVSLALVLVFAIIASQKSQQSKAASEQARAADGRARTAEEAAAVSAETVEKLLVRVENVLQSATIDRSRRVEIEQRLKRIEKKSTQPVQLNFVVDCSLSLGDELPELKSAVRTITRVMSELGREVTVSVAGYRERLVAVMPATRIVPESRDRGVSAGRLDRVLTQLEAVNGYVDVEAGFRHALKQPAAAGGKEILLWLADQDAREAAEQLGLGSQAAIESRLVSSVKRWAAQPGTDRQVVAFYAGQEDPIAPPLFNRLASATPGGVFEDDVMNLLAVLLQTTLPDTE